MKKKGKGEREKGEKGLNIDTSRTVVGLVFHFSSSSPTCVYTIELIA